MGALRGRPAGWEGLWTSEFLPLTVRWAASPIQCHLKGNLPEKAQFGGVGARALPLIDVMDAAEDLVQVDAGFGQDQDVGGLQVGSDFSQDVL